MTSNPAHTAAIQSYYDAWDKRDTDAIMATLTEDVVLEDVPTGHIARGAESARVFVDAGLALVADASYDVVSIRIDGDEYAVEWVMQPAGVRGVAIGEIRDGRIALNRDYWNLGGKPA